MISPPSLNIYHLYVGDFTSSRDLVKVRSLIDYLAAYISDTFWYNGIRSYFQVDDSLSIRKNVTSSIFFISRRALLIPLNEPSTQSLSSFTDADIQRAIKLEMEAGNIPVDSSSVYMVIFRGNYQQVRDQNSNRWLTDWCGYHGNFHFNDTISVTYGVVGDPFSISANNSSFSDASNCIFSDPTAKFNGSEVSVNTVAANLGGIYATSLAGILTNPNGTGWYKRVQPLNPPSKVVEVGEVCNKDFNRFVSAKIGHANISFQLPQIYRLGYGCWPSLAVTAYYTGWYYYDGSIGLDSLAYLPLGLKTMVDGSSIQDLVDCDCSRYSWGNSDHTLVADQEGYPIVLLHASGDSMLYYNSTSEPTDSPTSLPSESPTSLADTSIPLHTPTQSPTPFPTSSFPSRSLTLSPTTSPSDPTGRPMTASPSQYLYPCASGTSSNGIDNCQNHANIIIPTTQSSVSDNAFLSSCRGIQYIYIPTAITRIGTSAFSSCSSLANIVIPTTVSVISDNMLQGSGLFSMVIPTSILSIGSYAFDSMPRLTTVVIPTSVTFIGAYAFSFCPNLTCAVIPPRFQYMERDGTTFRGSPLKGCPTAAPSWYPVN